MKILTILGLASCALFASSHLWSPAQAQTSRCMPAEFMIAKARAERPSTEILARVTGNQAASLLAAFSNITEDSDADSATGDEITVLRNALSDEVLVIVAEEGCALWRAQLSRADYEHATWKAWGLPV